MKRRALLVLIAAALAGQAGALEKVGPTWSEVTGNLFPTAQMHRTAAVISKVDGDSTTDRIVKVAPGKHTIVVRSPMRKGLSGTDLTMDMVIEPCKRYYINTQFKSSTGRDWEPLVTNVEAVPGCKLPPAP